VAFCPPHYGKTVRKHSVPLDVCLVGPGNIQVLLNVSWQDYPSGGSVVEPLLCVCALLIWYVLCIEAVTPPRTLAMAMYGEGTPKDQQGLGLSCA
jgi:hypothetical protein